VGDFMKEYLSHLLPRLIEFSDSLDRKELFVDQPWVHVDENQNKQQYIFKRDGTLIMSVNGDVRIGSWEYISATAGLLIDRGIDKVLLNQRFIDRGVLVLKKDNFFDDSFLLVNQKLVVDLDVEKYLRDLVRSRIGRSNFPLEEGIALEYESDFLELGNPVFVKDKPAGTGSHTLKDGVTSIAVKEGRLAKLRYERKYPTREGLITVSQNFPFKATVGDNVMKLSRPAPDGVYNPLIPDQPIFQVKDGRIFKVGWGGKFSDWIGVIILIILALLINLLKRNT
jgi:hypothetical protein